METNEESVRGFGAFTSEGQIYREECERQTGLLNSMERKIDDLENRRRRNNLIFFEFKDTNRNESVELSDRCAAELCRDRLVTLSTIQRAYRIGRFGLT